MKKQTRKSKSGSALRALFLCGVSSIALGATAVANGARLSAGRPRQSVLALVNGVPGVLYAPEGKVTVVLAFSYRGNRISGIEVIAQPSRLDALELAVLD